MDKQDPPDADSGPKTRSSGDRRGGTENQSEDENPRNTKRSPAEDRGNGKTRVTVKDKREDNRRTKDSERRSPSPAQRSRSPARASRSQSYEGPREGSRSPEQQASRSPAQYESRSPEGAARSGSPGRDGANYRSRSQSPVGGGTERGQRDYRSPSQGDRSRSPQQGGNYQSPARSRSPEGGQPNYRSRSPEQNEQTARSRGQASSREQGRVPRRGTMQQPRGDGSRSGSTSARGGYGDRSERSNNYQDRNVQRSRNTNEQRTSLAPRGNNFARSGSDSRPRNSSHGDAGQYDDRRQGYRPQQQFRGGPHDTGGNRLGGSGRSFNNAAQISNRGTPRGRFDSEEVAEQNVHGRSTDDSRDYRRTTQRRDDDYQDRGSMQRQTQNQVRRGTSQGYQDRNSYDNRPHRHQDDRRQEFDRGRSPPRQSNNYDDRPPPPCRDFSANGSCNYGDNCRFSHDGGAVGQPFRRGYCRLFEQGHCQYGSNCRYIHDDVGGDDSGGYGKAPSQSHRGNRPGPYDRPPQSGGVRVCFNYRDNKSCNFGDECKYAHHD